MTMYITFFIDFISVLFLLSAFSLLWRERLQFYSLRPLLSAILFLVLAHICDMLLEHPDIRLSEYFDMTPGSFESVIAIIGNSFDTVGITFLIYGFVRTIKFKRIEEKRIRDLEQMLPLCSNCKKYRTEEGEWYPIEKYLYDSGAPKLTHGICPECAEILFRDILRSRNR